MHGFSSRVTSWLTWTLRVGGFVLRRHIGASVIRPLHLGWPTQQQRRAQEAVAVAWPQPIPRDRHRQIKGKFCTIVGGVTTPCLSNIYLHHGLDVWFEHTVRPRLKGRASLVRYADDVRHITRCWIPYAERRGLEDMIPGSTAYPAAKVKGDRSMPSKRERSEDADDPVPQGPRDTVRTELFEPQPPTMQAYIPRHSVLRRGHRDRAARMSSLEPSTRWAMGHHPIQGGERGTYVALDTSSTTGMWDRPTRREAQGDGAAVVLRGRESRPHGEGRQVS